jgi:glucose/arabinose dehydrogenase
MTVTVTGLAAPWGLGFLPGGDALVTERDTGRVLRLTTSGNARLVTTFQVAHDRGGENGLLGLAVSPALRSDHRVYVYESTDDDNRVVRFTLHGTTASGKQPVLTGIPTGRIHDGGRIAFGPDRDDEVNRIHKGDNYGWTQVVGTGGSSRFTDPLVTFPPMQNSASGLAITGGALWTAALRGTRLWRIPQHANGTLGRPQPFLVGRYGRLRTVTTAPDGSLWVTTSNRDNRGTPSPDDDRVLRVALRPG